MNLWTEYEGRTIDGAYPLTKLIQPEGRSAFFSTSNGTGKPTVIRLIESHFDGDEILTRWRGVEAVEWEFGYRRIGSALPPTWVGEGVTQSDVVVADLHP